jgi:hypothetical protein
MAKPVGADLLCGNPRKMDTETNPEVVVAAGAYSSPILVAQQLSAYRSVTLLGVLLKVRHQSGGNRLPAEGFPLLAESDEALVGVEISRTQRQRTPTPTSGFGVQAQ